ncbi:MAG: ATP-binding protein [Verrucomicrobiae bacterium]|nr:ATP-binding protein [Verrucomicrobiae bacterium]
MQYNPIAVLLGPRQCGKTTLARELAKDSGATFFDLETSADQARLQMPETVLGGLSGLVVIDEVQRMPGLFTVLRPLVDKPGLKARFLLLGSASPELVKGVSESLAGRVGFVDMSGFEICDVGSEGQNRLWLRGGFPRSFLAGSDTESYQWRQDFIRTFLERDVPQLGLRIPAAALMRFWTMLAHYHGQIWNGSEIARALGVSAKTVRDYLDILTGAFVLRQLQPWHENIGKRQYKAPKVYVRDSGVLHALLGIEKWLDLFGHPKYGSSWEGFALEQILTCTGTRQAFYWATHGGAELDLMLIRGGKRYGVEFKCADAPGMTKSLHIAMDDLGLERVWIVYPGQAQYDLAPRVRVCPLLDCISELAAV